AGFPSSWAAFAKAFDVTIAAEDPTAKIFYTIDGSTPTSSSLSASSPLVKRMSSSGMNIRWYADDGAPEPAVHSFTAEIPTTLQAKYGYVVDDVKLDGKSPVVVASPGETLGGSLNYSAWVSSGCPACRQQIVYGIDATPIDCVYDWSPGVWPGVSGTAVATS